MKLTNSKLAISILGIMIIVIFTASAMGFWQTESNKTPQKFQTGDLQGQYNPADIRGSYTFGEISKLFNIPLNDLAQAFNVKLDGNEGNFKCKELETIFAEASKNGTEIGTGSVKAFVALYLGVPYELDDIYFTETGVKILINTNNLSSEQIEYVKAHTIK